MRDLLILILVAAGCLYSLRSPWFGAIMWTVVSLGSPHLQFGYAAGGWPVALAIAVSTCLGLGITKYRRIPFNNGAVTATLVLALWMCVTQYFALEFDLSYDNWERSMKIFVMLFVTLALIDDRRKLEFFIWANVAAIGYYGVKGGLFSIMTGGHFIIIGPGGFIGGNNELALAEIVVLPLMRYLQLQAGDNKWLRRGMGVAMALVAISVVVSHSRGALLGLAAMVSFFWFKNGNKLRWGAAIVLAGVLVLGAMPEEWWNRMDTIKTYEEDTSAQGRINAWWTAWNIANDRITGGGTRVNVAWIFAKYAPDPRAMFVAHSIYFQMMGEQGFLGLIIFLTIGGLTWFNAQRMIRAGKRDPALRWAAELGSMVHVSMLGFGVTGAFLSMAYFDLPYNVMGITAISLHLIAARAQPSSLPKPAAPAKNAAEDPSGPAGGRPPPPRGKPGRLAK